MAYTPTDLFRKAALDQLESPEQLDTALRVTDRKGWLALVACFAVLAAVLAWSVVGRLPTRVVGRGILVSRGGLNSLNAPTAGQVAELYVQPGTRVQKDQLVARLLQPELELDLHNARAALLAAEEEHRRLSLFGSEEARLRREAIRRQRASALAQLSTARERLAALGERLAAQQRLLKDGLITEAVQQATRDSLNQATGDMQRAQAALAEADLADKQNEQRTKKEADERVQRIAEARRRVDSAESRILSTSRVKSPAAGVVLELRTTPGQFVAAGAPVAMLELAHAHDAGLQALLYLSGADGKRLREGMAVEISPSTVRREEYGALRGVVRSVSAFPATQEAMLAHLGNPDLVAAFLKTIDSPIQVEADVLPSARTPSGYQWTSRRGPPAGVQPGTLCTASITVREQAPIQLVLPLIQERLGL